MPTFSDNFDGAAGVVAGRVSPTGHVWTDPNDNLRLDGNGRMIRNPAKEGVATGSYAGITLDVAATTLSADVSWTGTSSVIQENGALVLISGSNPSRPGTPPSQGIFSNCIHAVFGLWAADITMFDNNAASQPPLIHYTYPGGPMPTDGTIKQIAIYIDGERVGALMPDGKTIWGADPRVPTYTGRHLIFQTYNDLSPDLRPRLEAVAADTTKLVLGDPRGVESAY